MFFTVQYSDLQKFSVSLMYLLQYKKALTALVIYDNIACTHMSRSGLRFG